MPTYEYKCDACGHAFEKFQSIKAAPIRKCPNCGKMKVRKLISKGAGLIFKGSGFYITDYRSEGYKDQAKAEGSGAAKSESKDSGTSVGRGDGKSESKSDSKPAAESAPAKTQSKAEAKPAATASSKSDSKPATSSKSEKK